MGQREREMGDEANAAKGKPWNQDVGRWVFIVPLNQLFCMFASFHNKMLGRKGTTLPCWEQDLAHSDKSTEWSKVERLDHTDVEKG